MGEGFLGTAAPRYADVVLVLEIAMGMGLAVGAVLARLRKYRAHACCQSAIVLLNIVVIAVVMVPSFSAHVGPKVSLRLATPYYTFATAHAVLGAIAQIAGLYVVLAAGTNVVPKRFRITRYRLWMRTLLALWWVVVLSGLAVYARWYVPR